MLLFNCLGILTIFLKPKTLLWKVKEREVKFPVIHPGGRSAATATAATTRSPPTPRLASSVAVGSARRARVDQAALSHSRVTDTSDTLRLGRPSPPASCSACSGGPYPPPDSVPVSADASGSYRAELLSHDPPCWYLRCNLPL